MAVFATEVPMIGGDRSYRAKKLGMWLEILLMVTAIVSLGWGHRMCCCMGRLRISSPAAGWLEAQDRAVLLSIRLPRVVMGIFVGAVLALSGTMMQGLFRNPLADPGIIGVSSGASRGAILALVLGAALPALPGILSWYLIPIAAFTGLRRGAGKPRSRPCFWRELHFPRSSAGLYQELSGGEQQRVQLARVLAQVWQHVSDRGASWLLLDEPVSSLDIAHQLGIMRLAADYAHRGGGVIAVMHDLNLSALFAHRAVLMHKGQVVSQGAPEQAFTDHLLSHAYDCAIRVNCDPAAGHMDSAAGRLSVIRLAGPFSEGLDRGPSDVN